MSNGSEAFGKTAKLGIGLTSLFGVLGAVFRVRSPQRPDYSESSGLTAVFISTEPRPGNRSAQTTQRHQLE